MKKKYLFIGILLTLMLFILTGCGKTQQQDTQETGNDTTNVESSGDSSIEKVYIPFSTKCNEAIVKLKNDDNKIYVVNEDGKIVYETEFTDDLKNSSDLNVKYINGYLIYNNNIGLGNTYQKSYVVDLRNNEKIFDNAENIIYKDVTYNGYVLENTQEEGLSGTKYESKIVDKQGNTIWSAENEGADRIHFETICKDLVLYGEKGNNNNVNIINAQTGEVIFEKKYSNQGYSCRNGYVLIQDSIIDGNSGKIIFESDNKIEKLLNDKYYYSDNKIYSFDGNMVKDLSEGKVSDIIYSDGKYYVISETNFYYSLDENFEYEKQPEKISETIYLKPELESYGVTFVKVHWDSKETADSRYILGFDEFKPNEDVTNQAKIINGDFPLTTILDTSSDDLKTRIFAETNGKSAADLIYKLINCKTFEEIKIHK